LNYLNSSYGSFIFLPVSGREIIKAITTNTPIPPYKKNGIASFISYRKGYVDNTSKLNPHCNKLINPFACSLTSESKTSFINTQNRHPGPVSNPNKNKPNPIAVRGIL